MEELKEIYNKGYSSGFYLKMPTSDDFSSIEDNASKKRKHFVGKIIHYFEEVGEARIKLSSELKIGDEIIVIGNMTGLEKIKVENIIRNNKPVKRAYKGEEINIKLPRVRKNDEVYVIKTLI